MLFQYTFFPLFLVSDTVLYNTIQYHFWSLCFSYPITLTITYFPSSMKYATRFRSAHHLVSSSVSLSIGGGAHYPPNLTLSPSQSDHTAHVSSLSPGPWPILPPPSSLAPLNHPPFSHTPSPRSAVRSLITRYPRWYILKTPKTPLCRRSSRNRRSRSTRWIHIY